MHPDARAASLSAVSLRVGFGRTMLAPLVPLVLLGGGVAVRLSPAAVILLLLLVLVVIGVALIGMMSPGVVVQGGWLRVPGQEARRRSPGGTVDLTRLVSAKSVSSQGGRISGRGVALFRSTGLAGGRRRRPGHVPGLGLVPEDAAASRPAGRGCLVHARMDPMTWARLGFRRDQGAQISWIRRFI